MAKRPTQPPLADLDALLDGDAASTSSETGSGTDAPQAPPVPEPTVALPVELFDDDPTPKGVFSDDPPEGWGAGDGNVLSPDPVTSQLSPEALGARQSLLEDAARASTTAKGGDVSPRPGGSVSVAARAATAPDIRQALARAAAAPEARRYRSRISVSAAYQYDGRLHQAPEWVDRNWAAYDHGPAIDVPDVGTVRMGQWIVLQNVLDDDGGIGLQDIKVYDDGVFRSLFMVTET